MSVLPRTRPTALTTSLLVAARRRGAVALALVTVLLGAGTPVLAQGSGPVTSETPAVDSPLCIPRAEPVKSRLRLVGTRWLDPRTAVFSFRSAAVGTAANADGIVRVRVLLPVDYRTHRARRFHVLMYLHGTGGDHRRIANPILKGLIGKAPVITVMPDGGLGGYQTDWYGTPRTGRDVINGAVATPPPAWETFHVKEVLPWVDRTFRTTGRRAIAGSSMGGHGAMSYPARHPGVFKAAASFSGAVHLDGLFPVSPLVLELGYDPCIWGDRTLQADNWAAHDPTALAPHLKGVALFVSSGNGLPGRYDTAATLSGAPLEILLQQHARDFVAALGTARIPVTTWFYGPGTHPDSDHVAGTGRYDNDSLRRFLPQALKALGRT